MLSEVAEPSKEANPFKGAEGALSHGILNIFEPTLKAAEKQLYELTQKQASLLEELHKENLDLAALQHSVELQSLFGKLKVYTAKLVNIKKDIRSLHEKSVKLKKRALKLQQFQLKNDYLREQKNMQLKREESLIKQS